MALRVRRVVTGHDKDGKAIVQVDEVSQNLRSARPGATACVVWTSQGFPVDNTGNAQGFLPGTFPTSVTAANLNIQQGTPAIMNGTGQNLIHVDFPAAGPIISIRTTTSWRHRRP